MSSGELDEGGCGGEPVASGEEDGEGTSGEVEGAVPKAFADLPMAAIIMNMLLSLSASAKLTLKKRVQSVHRLLADGCFAGFLVSTACSGTDLIVPTLSLFFSLVFVMLGVPDAIKLDHSWSCEWTP